MPSGSPALTYLGSPCRRGHDGVRYLSNKQCVDCTRGHAARRLATNPDAVRAMKRASRAKAFAADPGKARRLQQAQYRRDKAVRPDVRKGLLPTDAKARKGIPIATGVLFYFPLAVAAVAELSRIGNDQHNPGQPLHWDRSKSTDHADTLVRHLLERGTLDSDGVRHSAKVAWRALALLQTEIEAERQP